jgi:hypothetical protein
MVARREIIASTYLVNGLTSAQSANVFALSSILPTPFNSGAVAADVMRARHPHAAFVAHTGLALRGIAKRAGDESADLFSFLTCAHFAASYAAFIRSVK